MLAALTKGGNLPFRRLCVSFGAKITLSEMAWARNVAGRRPSELALLRNHETETEFGVQLAVRKPNEAIKAALVAVDRGASFVDVNAGCPINDAVRRGLGAALLERPSVLVKLVEPLVEALDVPVTVKIRSGYKEGKENAPEVARLMEEAGASALFVHGRTREQRYQKTADWQMIGRLVEERSIPIIGNGDIYTWYEAKKRREVSGCSSVVLARGALIKPWLFREIAEGRSWSPTAEDRVGVYRQLACNMKEHFRDDEKGRVRAMRFLPWHFQWFCRYQPLSEERMCELSDEHPLLQTRVEDKLELGPLDRLLANSDESVHEMIAAELWDSESDADAVDRLLALDLSSDSSSDEIPSGT